MSENYRHLIGEFTHKWINTNDRKLPGGKDIFSVRESQKDLHAIAEAAVEEAARKLLNGSSEKWITSFMEQWRKEGGR